MGIAGTIMHQSARDQDGAAAEHLEAEWRLFQAIEAGALGPLCRTWEAARPVVVVGRNTSIADQVLEDVCLRDGVPVLRRCSGGGAVILGPGCLNYALGVSFVSHPEFEDVAVSFSRILQRITGALNVTNLTVAGGTDLTLNSRKVSGNAQRRGQRALMHHGTLLYAFDSRLAARYLRVPSRQPAYRAGRQHTDFIGNLPLSREVIEARIEAAWSPHQFGSGL
jgi:lipoate-protein ligase A